MRPRRSLGHMTAASSLPTAGGETVYSSPDRLYLATWKDESRTQVHAFALDGTATSYVASGSTRRAVTTARCAPAIDASLTRCWSR